MSEPAEQIRPMRRRRHSRAAVDLRGVPSQPGPAGDSGEIPRSTQPPDTNPLKLFGVPRAVVVPAAEKPPFSFTDEPGESPFSFTPAANTVPGRPGVHPVAAAVASDDAEDDPFVFATPGFPPQSPAPQSTSPRSPAPHSSGPEPDASPFVFAPATPQETAPAPAKRSLFRRVDPSWRSVVAVSIVLGGLGGVAWGITHPPQYAGRADFVIDATVDLTGAPATALQQATDRDVATQAELLGNQGVRATAIGLLGTKEFQVKTRSDKDSNVISVSVTAPSSAQARRARAAYTKAYLRLVGAQQSKLLAPQMAVASKAVVFDQKSLATLDADLLAAPKTQRATLVAQQNAQRLSITSDLRDNQQRQARLRAAQDSVPVNVQPLPEETPVEPSGLGALQWTALGLTLGAGTGAVISLRLAERRSLAARLL